MRLVLAFIACLYGSAAAAAITCEQLGNIAFTTEQLRNEGYSLPTVLNEADKLETSDKLTKVEIARVREVVEQAFRLTRTPLEILKACNDTPRR